MHDILITADNLSYKINENRLFSSVSFSLKKGECLHIKGSNGSGKSTLLRIILGITSPTKGEIKANVKKNIAYYRIPVNFQIKGNFLGYIKFKRQVAMSQKMLNFDKETIKVIKGDTTSTVVVNGVLTIVGLPDEFF